MNKAYKHVITSQVQVIAYKSHNKGIQVKIIKVIQGVTSYIKGVIGHAKSLLKIFKNLGM